MNPAAGVRSATLAQPAALARSRRGSTWIARTWHATGTTVGASPQVKWAGPLNDALSVGVVASAGWVDTSPRFVGSTLVVPLTWQPSETLLVHANVGRDFLHDRRDSARLGAAIEWAPLPSWSFVAERFREFDANFWRAGIRHALSPSVSADLSQAAGMGGGAPRWWTLGLTWVIDR